VQSQVELYLAQHGGKADPNALYVLEGGGNDILDATSTSPAMASTLGFEIGATLASIEIELRQLGATHFLIPNLFSVGLLPAGRSNAAFDEIAANTELGGLLEQEDYLEGIHIYNPDIFHLWHAIYTDPTHYGFDNIITPCLNATTGAVCADPAHTLYWDADHPTTFGHSFLAVAIEALVHP
jgi:outer membrane lipase/esterase